MLVDTFRQLLLLTLFICCIKCEDVTLKCDEFERLYDLPTSELFCTVSGFMVSHSQIVKIPKYPKANMTKFMKFYDSRLLYVPFKLFDVFSNLKTLDVSYTEILEITRNTFGSASTLTFLNMSHNNITEITTSVFMGANSLMRLDLSHNCIAAINENAFRGLSNLDKLQLSFNKLHELNKDTFLENNYVETIALDNNELEYIEPEVFNRLRRIRDINLSNNRIHHIHAQTFQSALSLESLLLSQNLLNEFQLPGKNIQTQLHLDNNNLTSFAINGTKYVRATHNRISQLEMVNSAFLETLELSYNNISDIANLTNISGLLVLDLSYNPVGALNITTFDRLKRLRTLNLRATGVTQLSFGMLSKQTNLDTLDLSFNNLTELNLDVFVPYLANLKQLFVDGNNLRELQGTRSFSIAFQNLLKLGVSRNHFNCSYLHSILIPPYLLPSVALHIEPDVSAVEMSHIRDVSCISNVNESLQMVGRELLDLSDLHDIMEQSLNAFRLHEKKLEIYLLLTKIALLAMVCLLIGFATVRLWRAKRSDYFMRRRATIVYRSSENSTIEN